MAANEKYENGEAIAGELDEKRKLSKAALHQRRLGAAL
jgi:hypothetical protein